MQYFTFWIINSYQTLTSELVYRTKVLKNTFANSSISIVIDKTIFRNVYNMISMILKKKIIKNKDLNWQLDIKNCCNCYIKARNRRFTYWFGQLKTQLFHTHKTTYLTPKSWNISTHQSVVWIAYTYMESVRDGSCSLFDLFPE